MTIKKRFHKKCRSGMHRTKKQIGFSLIEVLVAMVVLSIGLVGLAALQGTALKNSYATFQRSLANLQIQEANERLWVIRCQLRNNPTDALNQARLEWQNEHLLNNNGLFMEDWVGDIVQDSVTSNSGIYTVSVEWLEKNTNTPSSSTPRLESIIHIPFINCP